MKFDGEMKFTGRLQILVNNKIERDIKNLVVNVGKEWVASRMKDTDGGSHTLPAHMTHMAVGTGAGDTLSTQTTLTTEIFRKVLQTDGGTVTGPQVQYSCTYQDTEAEGALVEAGLFNDATLDSGAMLARTDFDTINKGSGDVMTIIWTITVA